MTQGTKPTAADFPSSSTRRATVKTLEDILYEPFPVLGHGFIRVIDYMGDDNAIVQAARVSYGKGTKKVNEDRGLIRYLLRHHHTTPFEMCEIKFHIKLPIFVARQWIRHRTANVNEYSARYSILDKEFYIPCCENMASQAKLNHQGREAVLPQPYARDMQELLNRHGQESYNLYQWLLNESPQEGSLESSSNTSEDRPGLARELSRMVLPLNYYTQWYWKIDLHNLLHFVRLRIDPHAQHEIRVYAQVLTDIVARWVPHTYEAFCDYRLEAQQFSKQGLEIIKRLLQGETVQQEETSLSLREWRELMIALGRDESTFKA